MSKLQMLLDYYLVLNRNLLTPGFSTVGGEGEIKTGHAIKRGSRDFGHFVRVGPRARLAVGLMSVLLRG